MSRTIAIFGAGSGLGTSVARRFGREDHRVALIGRREAPLSALATQLGSEGIEAMAFPADLADVAATGAVVSAIRDRFGRIDVVHYAPIAPGMEFIPASALTPSTLGPMIDLYLLAPVELVSAVLPEMQERGDGAILVGHGASVIHPQAMTAAATPVMAATRNWLYSLNAELAPRGVYVGAIAVAAMIDRSESHAALTSGAMKLDLPEGMQLPLVDPDELAEELWQMTVRRDRVELVHPPIASA